MNKSIFKLISKKFELHIDSCQNAPFKKLLFYNLKPEHFLRCSLLQLYKKIR
jgi:hypothetical protein